MSNKAVISLSTGLEDAEKVTVAFLVAIGAAETGRETLMFPSKEAVRLSLTGTAAGVACDGRPPLADLFQRYQAAGGRYHVCPLCFTAKQLDAADLIPGAEINGTIPMWKWIGDEPATTFSYRGRGFRVRVKTAGGAASRSRGSTKTPCRRAGTLRFR